MQRSISAVPRAVGPGQDTKNVCARGFWQEMIVSLAMETTTFKAISNVRLRDDYDGPTRGKWPGETAEMQRTVFFSAGTSSGR
ncbi:unnamed protein product [Caenorhabditis auriculariae]|uniref:Uncharacterized protein n=1 Tax=Caenorhabditis auriculariae TaxID=2777116 RepID=A0A8S1HQ86_9PELO|nr:unnamed protein product [Caenorhabditis auriculariae]